MDVCGNWDLNFAGCCTVLPRCHIERPKNTKRNTVLCFSLLAVLWPLVCQSHDRPALLRTGELCSSWKKPVETPPAAAAVKATTDQLSYGLGSWKKPVETPPAAAAVKATKPKPRRPLLLPLLSKPRPTSLPTDWGAGRSLRRPLLLPLPLSKPRPSLPTDWGAGRSLWRPLLLRARESPDGPPRIMGGRLNKLVALNFISVFLFSLGYNTGRIE